MASIDYGAIIRRSFQLTKKYKWLWVYGLIIAAASGGANFNSFSNLGSDSSQKSGLPVLPKDLPEQSEKVLGQATDWLMQSFAHVPPLTWLLLTLGLILIVVFAVGINWVAQSFAKGALISGLNAGDNEEEVTLKTTGKQGIKSIKPLIGLTLLLAVITLGIFVVVGAVLLVFFLLSSALHVEALMVILMIIAVVAVFIVIVIFAMMQVYAERLVVLKGYSAKEAISKSFTLSKGNFLPTVVMGIINFMISCSLGCASVLFLLLFLGVPAVVALLPSFQNNFTTMPSMPIVFFLLILVVLAIIASIIFRAALVVFNFGTWNLLFKELLSEDEGGKKNG